MALELPTLEQIAEMLEMVRKSGISRKRLEALYDRGFFDDLLGTMDPARVDREAFRVVLGYSPLQLVFKVKMGGHENTDEVVGYLKANGFYVNDRITQDHFPLFPGSGIPVEDEIEIVNPGKSFTEKDASLILKEKGLLYPTHEHALRLVCVHEKLMASTSAKKMPAIIFFLRKHRWDFLRSRNILLYRNRFFAEREFDLSRPGNRFSGNCAIAGVRPRT